MCQAAGLRDATAARGEGRGALDGRHDVPPRVPIPLPRRHPAEDGAAHPLVGVDAGCIEDPSPSRQKAVVQLESWLGRVLQDLSAYVRTALVLEVGQVASVGQIRVDPPRKEEKSVAARRRAGEGRGGGPEGALAQRRAGWNLIRQDGT